MTTRLAFPVMGTMATIVVSPQDVGRLGEQTATAAMAAARGELELLDHRFSHYSADSEISDWIAGRAVSSEATSDIEYVLRESGRLREDSGGVFTITNPVTGALDTAGYVKGYAIGRAVGVIRETGLRNFLVGVGGDTFAAGTAAAERPWRVAVSDPQRSHAVVALIEATDLAVATSGAAERGDHIWNTAPAVQPGILSFTVVGPDIAEADAYATIGFAMGEQGIAWVAAHAGYRSLALRPDGTLVGDAALVSAA